jgi:hypothetical protein
VFLKELDNGIPNAAVWRVLRNFAYVGSPPLCTLGNISFLEEKGQDPPSGVCPAAGGMERSARHAEPAQLEQCPSTRANHRAQGGSG